VTKEEYKKFKKATKCHLCRKHFRFEDEKIDLGDNKFKIIPKNIIVRDHCHITSELNLKIEFVFLQKQIDRIFINISIDQNKNIVINLNIYTIYE